MEQLIERSRAASAQARASTTSRHVAAGALAAGLPIRAERVNGATIYYADPSALPDGVSLDAYGAEHFAKASDQGYRLGQVADAESLAFARASWRQRHHAGIGAEIAYTKQELDAMDRATMEVEMPLVEQAIRDQRVSGFVKTVPVECRPEPKFTRSEIESMHWRDIERLMPQIEAAQAEGAIDFSR